MSARDRHSERASFLSPSSIAHPPTSAGPQPQADFRTLRKQLRDIRIVSSHALIGPSVHHLLMSSAHPKKDDPPTDSESDTVALLTADADAPAVIDSAVADNHDAPSVLRRTRFNAANNAHAHHSLATAVSPLTTPFPTRAPITSLKLSLNTSAPTSSPSNGTTVPLISVSPAGPHRVLNESAIHSFISKNETEMERINVFYKKRLSELHSSFQRIEQQTLLTLDANHKNLLASLSDDDVDLSALDAVRAKYVDLYKETIKLHEFTINTFTDFTHLFQQFELWSGQSRVPLLERLVSYDMTSATALIALQAQIEQVYAELTVDIAVAIPSNSANAGPNDDETSLPSDVSMALLSGRNPTLSKIRARSLLFSHQPFITQWNTFHRGLRMGICLLLFFWVLWDCIVDARMRPAHAVQWVKSVLPVYRGIGTFIMLQWGWGCNLYLWDTYRINASFLLELDQQHAQTYSEVFDDATYSTMVFFANFLVYYKMLRGDFPALNVPAGVLPIALFAFFLWRILPNPFKDSSHSVVWRGIFNVVIGCCGPVTFLTIYIGDILTSLVKPIIDWTYTFCFFFSLEWLDDAAPNEHCMRSELFQFVLLPLISALPLFFRFVQCLRKYTEVNDRTHLLNAGKYALAHSVVLIGVLHSSFTDTGGLLTTAQLWWIVALVSSSLYSYAWDVYKDWGLGNLNAGGLRENLLYQSRWPYYFCIVIDLFLRFSWTLSLIPRGDTSPFPPDVLVYLQPLLAVGEVFRRCMWSALRLEWEQIHKPGFVQVDTTTVTTTPNDANTHQREWLVLELVLIVGMVLAVAMVAFLTAEQK